MAKVKYSALIKSKFKAAGIHLCISGVIFLILAYFIISEWYPIPYFTADGGWQGIRIIALIDLVLGPFLTLIIFNPGKSLREIRFDLSVIALIQASVLAWGIYTVHDERPVAIVNWDGEFYTMQSKSYQEQNYPIRQLSQFGTQKPALVHAYHPVEPDELLAVLKNSTEKNLAPFEQTQLYRPFKAHLEEIFYFQLSIDEIVSQNETMRKELDDFLVRNNGKKEDFIYMPLNARYHNVILIFSEDGSVQGALNTPYK